MISLSRLTFQIEICPRVGTQNIQPHVQSWSGRSNLNTRPLMPHASRAVLDSVPAAPSHTNCIGPHTVPRFLKSHCLCSCSLLFQEVIFPQKRHTHFLEHAHLQHREAFSRKRSLPKPPGGGRALFSAPTSLSFA